MSGMSVSPASILLVKRNGGDGFWCETFKTREECASQLIHEVFVYAYEDPQAEAKLVAIANEIKGKLLTLRRMKK